MATLTVTTNGQRMFPNLEALDANQKRFIGRTYQPIDMDKGVLVYGFVPTNEPVTIPLREEYMQALLDGDLIAADQATIDLLSRRRYGY
jgi:hypothetical protein